MTIRRTSVFKKQYKKLPNKIQLQFDARLRLFINDPSALQLRNHPLKGKHAGYWSINVSGDFRALYQKTGNEIILFGFIGTHSQLYG